MIHLFKWIWLLQAQKHFIVDKLFITPILTIWGHVGSCPSSRVWSLDQSCIGTDLNSYRGQPRFYEYRVSNMIPKTWAVGSLQQRWQPQSEDTVNECSCSLLGTMGLHQDPSGFQHVYTVAHVFMCMCICIEGRGQWWVSFQSPSYIVLRQNLSHQTWSSHTFALATWSVGIRLSVSASPALRLRWIYLFICLKIISAGD